MTLELSDNAKYILEQRYLKKNENREIIETPQDLFMRVSHAIALVEKKYGKSSDEVGKLEMEFMNMLTSLQFLPNSPTLMNAGTNLGILSACFVLPIEDDMESIMEGVKNSSLIHKEGGGTGFDFSNLRPKGDVVKKSGGVASGPVSFLKIYNAVTDVVRQGGRRRGANMGVLHYWHPDIEDFIGCKEKEGNFKNFNISVGVDDNFMKAVADDKDIELINPRTGLMRREVRARSIWNLILIMAWRNGEPGILFFDHMNEFNPTPELGEYKAVNPCLSGDTLISTTEGKIPIREMAKSEKDYDVYTIYKNNQLIVRKARNIRCTKQRANVLTIKTTRGNITCTPDHKFLVDGIWKEAKDLKKRERLGFLSESKLRNSGIKLGFKDYSIPEQKLVARYYFEDYADVYDIHHIDGNRYNNKISNLQLLPHGIHSKISNLGHKPFAGRNIKGQFVSKEIRKNKVKGKDLNKQFTGISAFVIDVIKESKMIPVYNMEVDETHNYIANRFVVKNCGEQVLLPWEACNLGSINISKFISEGRIQWKELENTIRLSVRFLDNVIDASRFPIPQITKMVKGNRKIGLGLMGWHDLLIMKGVRYDSEEAVQLARDVMKFVTKTARDESRKLGEEKGSFPNKDKSIFRDEKHMRNATVTTIAPTGTISIIANCSQGIEPLFALQYIRKVKDSLGKDLVEYAPLIKELLRKHNVRKISTLPDEVKSVLVTANEIDPMWHIRMQAAFQKYTDNAVSKTVNLPNSSTIHDIEQIYLEAYRLGCKGITVYRDGSRNEQLLNRCPDCEGMCLINEKRKKG